MNIILVLIPVTFLIVAVAIGVFFWAANHQQFDDLESPGVLPLMEERDTNLPTRPTDEPEPPGGEFRPPP